MRRRLLLCLFLLLPAPALAQALVADLTSHLIAITTGFTGTEVVLFGAVEGDGDVIVVVRGPEAPIVVRRKERVFGVWLNRRQMRFANVPQFYAVAATKPPIELAPGDLLAKLQIGTDRLALQAAGRGGPDEVARFRAALIEEKERDGLFPREPGRVSFVGRRLFRTTLALPSNVPTGTYQVDTYLLRGGQLVGAQTTPLLVSQLGISADIVDFAYKQSIFYGLAAVAMAVAAGWAASLAFRRR